LKIGHSYLLRTLLAFVLTSLGCGGGISDPQPRSFISATQHPLVAQYDISVPGAGTSAWVEFGPDANYGRRTSASAATTGIWQNLQILVAGMRPSTTYHMRAHVDSPGGSWVDEDHIFQTGAIPANGGAGIDGSTGLVPPKITVTRPTPSLPQGHGVELFSLVGPTNMLNVLATDLQGNVIWYYPGSGVIKPMQNGHFMVNPGGALREIDLAGNAIREVDLAQVNQSLQSQGYLFSVVNFHHDQLTLPDGHWIGLCNTLKEFTNLPGYPGVTNVLGDALVDIDPAGNVAWAWSGFDHLDINRHPLGLAPFGEGADWTHANGLVYTADGNLLLSMRNQDWILKIDYRNGQGSGDILWRLGDGGDYALLGGDSSQWFYAQHFPNLLNTNGSQMTLAVWDNGNARIALDGSSCGGAVPCYSRATIFQVDETARTANLAWQDLPGFFSFWGGSIVVVDTGNIEFDMTTPFAYNGSQILEVTHTDNPQIVWQLDLVGEFAYRGYRIPSLYPGVLWLK
jgi:arylsulfate sulfotransferase